MKIRTIVAAAVISVGTLGAVVGGLSVVASWSEWSRSSAASNLGASFERMLAIPEGIQAERSASTKVLTTAEPSAAERLQLRFGRALFFTCGGLLLSILVSCACGPVR